MPLRRHCFTHVIIFSLSLLLLASLKQIFSSKIHASPLHTYSFTTQPLSVSPLPSFPLDCHPLSLPDRKREENHTIDLSKTMESLQDKSNNRKENTFFGSGTCADMIVSRGGHGFQYPSSEGRKRSCCREEGATQAETDVRREQLCFRG